MLPISCIIEHHLGIAKVKEACLNLHPLHPLHSMGLECNGKDSSVDLVEMKLKRSGSSRKNKMRKTFKRSSLR